MELPLSALARGEHAYISRVGGQLNGAQAVNKSFPGFFDAVRSLGIAVEA